LRDILSEKTLIGMYPEIDDPAKELKEKQAEQAAEENTGDGEGNTEGVF
jgi:hypothetical protein